MKKNVLIIGGGFAGCAAARVLSKNKNLNLTLVESNSYLGAGVRTFYFGGHPYTFGPRHFLTTNKIVFDYLNKIVPMRKCSEHQFLTYVEKDNNFYNFPLNILDIKKMPDKKKIYNELKKKNYKKILTAKNIEEYWIASIGKTLYEKTINKYNNKMWMVDDNKKIDTFNWSPKGATIKKGNRAAWENTISAYPIKNNGYNDFFDNLIKKKRIKIIFKAKLKVKNFQKKIFYINNKIYKYDIIISTTSPDYLFNYKYGKLKYIGRDFHKIVLPTKEVFPKNVYFLYYANNELFTRLVEFKKLTKHKSENSLIGIEYPSKNGKHYPLPIKSEIKKAQKYLRLFPQWSFSIGRTGTYRYEVDIDDCIEQAMMIGKIIKNNQYTGALPLEKFWKI
jgi:UDP-galactopyranose mutase